MARCRDCKSTFVLWVIGPRGNFFLAEQAANGAFVLFGKDGTPRARWVGPNAKTKRVRYDWHGITCPFSTYTAKKANRYGQQASLRFRALA